MEAFCRVIKIATGSPILTGSAEEVPYMSNFRNGSKSRPSTPALPSTADVYRGDRFVRFVPILEVAALHLSLRILGD